MTDVRDPEARTAARTPTAAVAPPRQGFFARALSPLRRVTGRDATARELVTIPAKTIELRRDGSFDLEPKRQLHLIRWSLILMVVIPTIVSGIYLFAISSDQYVAEARFAVRQAEPLQGGPIGGDSDKKDSASPSVGGALSGTMNLGGEDAEIVASYIHSRPIIEDVARQVDLRAIFQRPEADFWARLPNDASSEDLTRYWNKMVTVYIEATSGIVTVSVSAFRREDALVLTEAILKSSEKLVNSLSGKIRTDMMQTAEDEVRRADGEVRFAYANLTSFRNSHQVIDPVKATESIAKLLGTLMSDRIEAEAQIYVSLHNQGPNAPGMSSLRDRLQSINDHIAELKSQMAGDKDASRNMAATLSEFENLELKKVFAESMYRFASNGVERARIASERQQVYLAVFVHPALPQDYTYPVRWSDLLSIAVASMMIWVCGATITASIQDHRL